MYAPTLKTNEDQKYVFYDALEWVLQQRSNDKIFFMGDFNARVETTSNLWIDVIGMNRKHSPLSRDISLIII